MTISIDDVCTHAQLAAELGTGSVGTARLDQLTRSSGSSSTEGFRQGALADVLKALSRRTPPIYDSHLRDVTELKDAVVYGTLERLYRESITAEGDVMAIKRKLYEERFRSEVGGLMPSLIDTGRGAVMSFSLERR